MPNEKSTRKNNKKRMLLKKMIVIQIHLQLNPNIDLKSRSKKLKIDLKFRTV